jgi:hypothetical protein
MSICSWECDKKSPALRLDLKTWIDSRAANGSESKATVFAFPCRQRLRSNPLQPIEHYSAKESGPSGEGMFAGRYLQSRGRQAKW